MEKLLFIQRKNYNETIEHVSQNLKVKSVGETFELVPVSYIGEVKARKDCEKEVIYALSKNTEDITYVLINALFSDCPAEQRVGQDSTIEWEFDESNKVRTDES